MEEVQRFVRNLSSSGGTASSPSFPENPFSFSGKGGGGLSASLSSSDQTRELIARPARNVVSLWTCSKLCAVFFAAGVIAGYTLKKRVRRWASKLLKNLKD